MTNNELVGTTDKTADGGKLEFLRTVMKISRHKLRRYLDCTIVL